MTFAAAFFACWLRKYESPVKSATP